MKKIFAPSAAAALVTVLTLAVTGGSWASGMESGMDKMSGDKKMSKEEWNKFSQLDTNKDGKISQEEAKHNADLADKFDSVDDNHDKIIDEGEFARFETDTEHNK
jgi:hypothetical protein